MILSSLLLCWAGCIALCLPLGRHAQTTLGHALTVGTGRTLRSLGALLLAGALLPLLQPWSPSVALSLWTLILTLAALGTMAMLTWCPRLLPRAGVPMVLLGTAIGLLSVLLRT